MEPLHLAIMRLRQATFDLPDWARIALVLALGVLLAGVGDFLLSRQGYPGIGVAIWVIGYGGTVFAVWALFVRGREFVPAGDGPGEDGSGERNR